MYVPDQQVIVSQELKYVVPTILADAIPKKQVHPNQIKLCQHQGKQYLNVIHAHKLLIMDGYIIKK